MARSSANKQTRHTKIRDPRLQKFLHAEQAQQDEAAYRYGSEILDDYNNHLSFLLYFARVCYRTGRLDEAVAAYNRLLQLKPDDYQTLYELGQIINLKGHHDQALLLFHAAL